MTSQAEIKKYQEENLLLKKQIEERTGNTVEQLYAERAKRVRDVIELREPDRMPFSQFQRETVSVSNSTEIVDWIGGRWSFHSGDGENRQQFLEEQQAGNGTAVSDRRCSRNLQAAELVAPR